MSITDREKRFGEWMRQEADTVISALYEEGHRSYLVGGCVRDVLLGQTPQDVDIATSATPEAVRNCFQKRGFKTVETGWKHGTVTVLVNGVPLEVTTFRIDGPYADHRRPDHVSFTSDIEEDLARRDFTVNALAWSPADGLVDACGGVKDLECGVLRCVGNPRKRFQEDALRILRALRFSATLGFSIEEETKKAMAAEKNLLAEISVERVFGELKKILAGRHGQEVLLEYAGILGAALPELLPMVGFDQHNPHHIYDVWEHTARVVGGINAILRERGTGTERHGCQGHQGTEDFEGGSLRLAALLHDIGKPETYSVDKRGIGHFYGHGQAGRKTAERFLSRMHADALTKERVDMLIRYHDATIAEDRRIVKRWLSRLGPELFFDLLALKRADNLAQNRESFDRQPQYDRLEAMAEEILEQEECFSLRDLAVNGKDLIQAGVPEGPRVGRLLRLLLNAVISGETENSREALLSFLKDQLLLS